MSKTHPKACELVGGPQARELRGASTNTGSGTGVDGARELRATQRSADEAVREIPLTADEKRDIARELGPLMFGAGLFGLGAL
jgi:hypothetical protein